MWQCPICGTRAWVTNKKRHLYTKKHKGVLYITTERFEMHEQHLRLLSYLRVLSNPS